MKLQSLLLPAFTSALVTIPLPEGPYGVSLINVQMNDTTRADPYTGKSYRLLPVTIIIPSGPASMCQPVYQPYMPNATAHYWEEEISKEYGLSVGNVFSEVELSLCEPRQTEDSYPLVFFSQGLAFPRQFYTILTTNLAAQGYAVVQVGIPGEISFIEFPDGQIELGHSNFTDASDHAAAVDVRTKDIKFVLNELSSHREDLAHVTCSVNTTSPSIYGHSFGGATALATLVTNDKFVGGVNVDGAFWGVGLNETTDRPFMILASTPNYTRGLSTVPNWAEVWPHLEGPKWLFSILNTTHNSFVDVGVLAEYFGLFKIPGLRSVLGNIDPMDLLKIQVKLLSAFTNFLNGRANIHSIDMTASTFEGVDLLNSTGT